MARSFPRGAPTNAATAVIPPVTDRGFSDQACGVPFPSGYWVVVWPLWSVTVSVAGLLVELPPVVGPGMVASSTKVNGRVPEVPAGVVTVTVTGPAGCAGVGNVSVVGLVTVTALAETVTPPMVTVVWPGWNPLPVTVTVVPPVGPGLGKARQGAK